MGASVERGEGETNRQASPRAGVGRGAASAEEAGPTAQPSQWHSLPGGTAFPVAQPSRWHSLPSGTAFPVAPTGVRPPQPQCECMCELGCASVLCRRTRVSPCTQPRDARVCGCVGGVGEHRWVPGPRRASPRQDPPAATTTIPQVLPVSCCKIHL